jgi:hypothetical protein
MSERPRAYATRAIALLINPLFGKMRNEAALERKSARGRLQSRTEPSLPTAERTEH